MKTFINLAMASSLTVFINPWVYAQADAQGEGIVTLGGQVIDSACGLELASVDQTIDMTPEPIGRLLRNALGAPHPFQLRLVNCSLTRPDPLRPGVNLPDWEHLRVTFDGAPDRDGRSFAAFGDSQGVALHIWDSRGEESVPGVPMALRPLAEGDMTLNYTLRLVGNGLPLAPGAHAAAVRFKLEYF
ncbi:type 1 fimbrial protein [Pseudomonas reactans]|uniref:Type 1 fimbrial protein n=1 Tax=Pseudomonas reactans TaxID=117680 RepID=A0ABX2QSU1_9PSED|nr:fimbrial protein [Pseudomonas reactans]NWA40815.1 type 1 fimbrial protein [Pseudomonas reactans]NWC86073.1 type 1 fimbrial protein [Pseudomonas reactans]NWD32233.1 type 1 fimbrial protein [Pseudomonas reactans]NWD94867.1 type 1 fimbrial protein [Pseudomonas reactans]NWF16892.1 type 1 fimbrial protein [Pseudomonas reactans]